jgi:molybdate transport system substrate-binding protein
MRVTLLGLLLFQAVIHATEVHVFAAASLTDSLKEIAGAYEKKTADKIVVNFGASSFLARQIEAGAPADLFFSADEAKMDELEKKGLIQKETRKNRLSNSLVVVVSADSNLKIRSMQDLVGSVVQKIALAEPRTVPAGIYAKEYLEKAGLWGQVFGKVIPTDNVRAALAAVEAGNADVAIVYKTDAAISKKAKVALDIPREEGPKIRYPMCVLRDAKEPARAREFLKYLSGEESTTVFRKFGFIVE